LPNKISRNIDRYKQNYAKKTKKYRKMEYRMTKLSDKDKKYTIKHDKTIYKAL